MVFYLYKSHTYDDCLRGVLPVSGEVVPERSHLVDDVRVLAVRRDDGEPVAQREQVQQVVVVSRTCTV